MTVSVDAQIRYLVQWFHEWSDLQRSDFLPIMVEKYADKAYVNGIVNSISNVNCRDKPMSLFECRVKLFKEWIPQWSPEQKESFMKQIIDIDKTFSEKFNEEIKSDINCKDEEIVNGENENIPDDEQEQQSQ